jgi:hypothetical protein
VPDQSGSLTGRREVVAVLRLVVSRRGSVLYGEVIDVETESHRTFRDWRGMRAAIREFVIDAVATTHADVGPPRGAEHDRGSV